MCGTIAIIVFIIALIMGIAWAGDLAAGLAGLFDVLATIGVVAILVILAISLILYLYGKLSQ